MLFERLNVIGMAEAGAELSRDVVACPGADTCNIAVTQSRGLADAIGIALEEAGLAEVGGIRTNISGCTNSCGQHHISDIGFMGVERRAHGKSAPGYQMLLGGYVGEETVHFGEKALRLPAKSAPQAVVRVVGRFAEEREAGEKFRTWMDRAGGAKALAEDTEGPRRVPGPRRRPRVLRRLRRDRAVRGRTRRFRMRGLMLESSLSLPVTRFTPSEFTDAELADLNREFETAPASRIIRWAAESFGPYLSLAASMADALVIDLATKVDPAIEVVFIDTGYHFPETLETVERIRRHYGLNLRMMTVAPHDQELWIADPENCCSAVKVGQLDRALNGKAAWMSGLRRDEAASRAGAPDRCPRHAGSDQGQPDRELDPGGLRRLSGRPRHPPQSPPRPGLPVDRVLAVHEEGRRGRRPPIGTVGRPRQDRVRAAPGLTARPCPWAQLYRTCVRHRCYARDVASATWQPPLDLFASAPERTNLNVRSWIEHDIGWARPTCNADPDWFGTLSTALSWRRAERTMYDRIVEVPRLMSWHQLDDDETPEPLRQWAGRIDREYDTAMTSAGVNLYRDGSDSVAWHADVVGVGRSDSTVAVVSLGASRPILVRPTGGGASMRWLLGHADLFVMGGASQRDFQHCIPKAARCGPRISVVFRETRADAEPEFSLPYVAMSR